MEHALGSRIGLKVFLRLAVSVGSFGGYSTESYSARE